MKNKNDKRGKSPANFYDRIAEMLGKAAIPQTITVEAEGVSPETFSAAGITKRELYATVAMASLAHAIITTPPVGGGRLRSDWARRVAAQAAELAYHLDEALGEIERNGEPAKDSRRAVWAKVAVVCAPVATVVIASLAAFTVSSAFTMPVTVL